MKSLVHFFKGNKGNKYCLDVNSSTVFEIDDLMKEIILGASIYELKK